MDGDSIKNRQQLASIIKTQKAPSNKTFGRLLLDSSLITRQDLEHGLSEQKKDNKKHLGEILSDSGVIDPQQVKVTLARKLGIPFIRLDDFEISDDVLSLVPESIALDYHALPLAIIMNKLVVAMDDVLNQKAIETLSFNTNYPIEPVLATHQDIAKALNKFYAATDEANALKDIDLLHTPDTAEESSSLHIIEQQANARPVIRLLNSVLQQGVASRASDIHIRPFKDHVDVYYRIDGVLSFSRKLDKSLLPALVSRIKITGKMDITERRLPQDGHTVILYNKKTIDLRISIIPTIEGESVVIRVLNKNCGILSLEKLGLPTPEQQAIKEILTRPHGLFLVTGPTGSGKSTTLYSLLNEIHKNRNGHILTVEDPVAHINRGRPC